MSNARKANQEKWYSVIIDFLESNSAQDQFCRDRELNKGTFQYWLKKYRDSYKSSLDGFVKIMEPALALNSNFILKVGDIEIVPGSGTSIQDIASLVRQLSAND